MEKYQVKIDQFEGPLDLLLHLIQKMEIAIEDISVSDVTDQYLNYIHQMQELELDVASEYLVMAATLLAIKSQTLLPQRQVTDEMSNYEEIDSKEALVQQLLEYKKIKEASFALKTLEEMHGLVFQKSPSDWKEQIPKEKGIPEGLEISIYDVMGAFQKMLIRKQLKKPLHTRIMRQEISIEEKMEQMLGVLLCQTDLILFENLLEEKTVSEMVVSFLALLELLKLQKIVILQKGNFEPLYVSIAGVEVNPC
ncbi:MAG: segregation/condensation protein A [Bacillales bacterium]|nr:segregation/condensation protein A [Bacillales bacterium]